MISPLTRFLLFALVSAMPFAAIAQQGLSEALTERMRVDEQRYGIAGQALLVIKDGVVVYRGVNGLADVEEGRAVSLGDVFPSYSLAKLPVTIMIMQLVEEGAVDLDAPVSRYVPHMPERWRSIPVRAFMNHTSGVPEYFQRNSDGTVSPDYRFPKTAQAVFSELASSPLKFAHGEKTSYTQTNYLVLAELLSKHYRKPYPEIADERIIRKLGLANTWLGNNPKAGRQVVTPYGGRDGKLTPEQDLDWPDYALGHAALHTTAEDFGRFMQAVVSGQLVGKATLLKMWQPVRLRNGQQGMFAGGWEYASSDGYHQVGHDGGTRVRVRILFKDSLEQDVYIIVSLTNGSARNVWSRVLVDGSMALISPDAFPSDVLESQIVDFALQVGEEGDVRAQAMSLQTSPLAAKVALESLINSTGYSVLENLGIEPAIRVFSLNAELYPESANAWDSLAEAHAAKGDRQKAQELYTKAKTLVPPATPELR